MRAMTERITPGQQDMLIVVDVQNDFCPGGNLAVPHGDEVAPIINRIAHRFPHALLTQDWHTADHNSFASAHPGKKPFETVQLPYGEQVLWPDHCVQGTHGAAFDPDLDVPRAELVLRKGFRRDVDSYSTFYENDRKTTTGLAGYLRERGIKRLFLTGLAFDFCVFYTAEDGHREGFEVTVIEDACRSIDLAGSAEAARKRMDALGVQRIGAARIIEA
jgi:nicotinamidase/pyrazinamidase